MKENPMIRKILKYGKDQYGTVPDHPWHKTPDAIVLRHDDNHKWYGLIFSATAGQLGITGDPLQRMDILNLKLDPMLADSLRHQPGILPGYHMNHIAWTTLLLDGTVPIKTIYNLLDMSYEMTASGKKKKSIRGPVEWVVPANPKYYDVVHAFDDTDTILWKQSGCVKVGDIIFLYVAAPVSAIMYRCEATEVDLPYDYEEKGLRIKKVMRIRLLHRYDPNQFTFDRLKTDYRIYAVRGPRSVPNSLSHDLNR